MAKRMGPVRVIKNWEGSFIHVDDLRKLLQESSDAVDWQVMAGEIDEGQAVGALLTYRAIDNTLKDF